MNRNYRGMTKEGKWVYGNYCNLAGLSYIATYPVGAGEDADGKIIANWIKVLRKTVGQSTGLKDKNGKGKEAYDGDRIAIRNPKPFASIYYEIRFNDGRWEMASIEDEDTPRNTYALYDWPDFEIIGTIHDKE